MFFCFLLLLFLFQVSALAFDRYLRIYVTGTCHFVSTFRSAQIAANLHQMTRFHNDLVVPALFICHVRKNAHQLLNSSNVLVSTLQEHLIMELSQRSYSSSSYRFLKSHKPARDTLSRLQLPWAANYVDWLDSTKSISHFHSRSNGNMLEPKI